MDDLEKIATSVENFVSDATAEIATLKQEVETLRAVPAGGSRRIQPDPIGGGGAISRGEVLGHVARGTGHGGFENFGGFISAVRDAGMRGGSVDERLLAAAPSTFGNEGSGTDGGFSVPPDFRTAIMSKVFGEDSLLARTLQLSVQGNSLSMPASMQTPWGAGGIQATWEAEGAAIPQTKPVLEEINVRLHKLGILVPASEELLSDAPAAASLIAREAAAKIDFRLSDAIAWGNGVGQPLGFMNGPCLVTQAKEGSQVADTIVAANAVNMLSRMPLQSRGTAVWLIHPDAEPQLPLMVLGDQPVYLPPGGMLNAAPLGMLLGRPVIPHQVCQTLGDLGDVMLVDLNQFLIAMKSGGVQAQTSIHLWFDEDITAFKFTVRVGGQPMWSEVTTAKNGTHTMSPFVTLAERA